LMPAIAGPGSPMLCGLIWTPLDSMLIEVSFELLGPSRLLLSNCSSYSTFSFFTPQYSGEMELLTKKIMICTIC
jgi:hypothetical protein